MLAGLVLVAGWAFAEAVLLFIVADVPISALALRFGWRAGWRAAVSASVAAALGGLAVMTWARIDPAGCRQAILSVPGISDPIAVQARIDWIRSGWQAMLAGSLSGVPYKLYAMGAGMQGSDPGSFFVGSIAARLPRFLLIAAVFSGIGKVLRPRAPGWLIASLFASGWCAFYTWYFASMASR